YREEANPIILVFLQTAILTLLAPAMLHGSIAGERERRSWDFLLVAPVTHAQIIFGKFMGAASAILATSVAFLLPIAIGAFYYRTYDYSMNYTTSVPMNRIISANTWNLFLAELLSVSWALMVCAMTIFFSARCKRGFIALGTSLAILIAGLIVWPILTASAGLMGAESNLLNFFHPFWALAQIESSNVARDDMFSSRALYGFPQIIVYFGMTIVFLAWTERTLRFADNEVKFLPKKKNA
ncbi:MAG: ABC transporter permease subunit, partial [Chlorobia bacterium]|nr:ABC transporter permease subunit [Fimbriimonadaceae bacterium]